MTPNPLDVLASAPHGTLEGERAGCVTSACPATPMTCAEVAGTYRRDIRFKRLYSSGLRGQELYDVFRDGRLSDAAAPGPARDGELEPSEAESTTAASAATPEPATLPDVPEDWGSLLPSKRTELLVAWEDGGLSFAEIAEMVGSKPAGIASALRAARKRRGEEAEPTAAAAAPAPQPEPTTVPEAEPQLQRRPEPRQAPIPVPVRAAEAVSRFGVPPMNVADIPGPQLLQAWVVLDREKRVVCATKDLEAATESLAAEWKRQVETGEPA
ncbi:hypothetical protein MUN78_07120 [Leucobacter allii]|uniref:RNA polymerase sigma factor 70 region 4 type 2 domain-containing protein n=1 Tax=Leucobacter allii TaxID=2932247 RepID=A0ABY4FQP4_9MICO|nr:hypothetical protein [Leucobacter allii]UOQ58588.1 hypothetical protein MUN78_07120 [Leucobacter allii]